MIIGTGYDISSNTYKNKGFGLSIFKVPIVGYIDLKLRKDQGFFLFQVINLWFIHAHLDLAKYSPSYCTNFGLSRIQGQYYNF